MTDNSNSKGWVPETREDWVGIFADGIAADRVRKEEADAKKNAADDANKGKEGGGKDDDGTPPKRTFAERLLGL